MRPYAKSPGVHKEKARRTEYTTGFMKGVSKHDKLITRNANRALKKALRQQIKQQLKRELYDNL